jgi:lipopolysaccharide transport system ATP-binding protein
MSPTTDVAIRVQHVSKEYRLPPSAGRPDSLRDAVSDAGARLRRWLGSPFGRRAEPYGRVPNRFWALKDVSLEVRVGEVLGIVGANGAGKSTLLKIMSRITEPSEGIVEIVGRVGSLLEVGTGFHPDLTGRENIYLNGALLGMRKAEIDRRFDEIVAFADVDRFIDTPVKHYSSGMYLRLAFAVGAHLETEILLVDEVLAVGDARFQEKCLDKMRDVRRHGRTVLFVSHNLVAVTRLCERAILIDGGKVAKDGPSHEIVSAYLNAGRYTTALRQWSDAAEAPGGDVVRLRSVRVRTDDGRLAETVHITHPVALEMEYDVLEAGHLLLPNFQFFNDTGIHMFGSHDLDFAWRRRRRPAGCYLSTATIPGNLLSEGTVTVSVGMETAAPSLFQFYVENAVMFRVTDSADEDSARGDYFGQLDGVVRPRLEWKTEILSND